MLSDELINKARRLVEVGFTERRRQLPLELTAIDSQAEAAGAYHSGTRLLQIHRVLARELDVRAILAWQSIVRVHQTLGIPADEGLATDLKQLFSGFLGSIRTELDALLRTDEQTEPNLRDQLTLDEACEDSRLKHDVEIDSMSIPSRFPQRHSLPPWHIAITFTARSAQSGPDQGLRQMWSRI